MMNIICKLFGHHWVLKFSYHIKNRKIKASDYYCRRCGTRKKTLFMDDVFGKGFSKNLKQRLGDL